ncbi:MAG: type II secretion system F family protein [Candidatus Omnitrophica bacterium]|nr:type II secretion system F family protein [Candidatus Omnitrophota bacterium]
MSVFLYKAKKGPKEFIEGELEAMNIDEATIKINSMDLFLLSIKRKKASFLFGAKVPLRELIEFTSQFSSLINSGSTLLFSLNVLSASAEYPKLSPIIDDIIFQIKEGKEFSQSLSCYRSVFSQLYISLVRAGELSGTLGVNLKRLSRLLEEESDFRANLISALTYPCLVLGVAILTVVVLLQFVIPKIANIFSEIDQVLPPSTLFLVNFSNFFTHYWYFVLPVLTLVALATKYFLTSKYGKLIWDREKLRIFGLGNLFLKIEISRFSRTLSLLLRQGLSMDKALVVAVSSVSNIFIHNSIKTIEKQIHHGTSLSNAVRASGIFPCGFVSVVKVGEESGSLDEALAKLADNYKKDINRRVKRMLAVVEPLLILVVGLIVGFVVVSMLLPIFDMDFSF